MVTDLDAIMAETSCLIAAEIADDDDCKIIDVIPAPYRAPSPEWFIPGLYDHEDEACDAGVGRWLSSTPLPRASVCETQKSGLSAYTDLVSFDINMSYEDDVFYSTLGAVEHAAESISSVFTLPPMKEAESSSETIPEWEDDDEILIESSPLTVAQMLAINPEWMPGSPIAPPQTASFK